MIIDIHTHKPVPQFDAVVSVRPEGFEPIDNQYYSIGIHPWDTVFDVKPEVWEELEKVAKHPQVLAIGECGIDTLKGGPLFRQMNVMKKQIELSEKLGKPLIIHDVRAHDIIVGIKKDMNPTQPWVIHGFRGKPTVARMLTDAGIWISFGLNFNPDSPKEVASERILVETDDLDIPIADVITRLSVVMGRDMTEECGCNASAFFGLHNETDL